MGAYDVQYNWKGAEKLYCMVHKRVTIVAILNMNTTKMCIGSACIKQLNNKANDFSCLLRNSSLHVNSNDIISQQARRV